MWHIGSVEGWSSDSSQDSGNLGGTKQCQLSKLIWAHPQQIT